MFEKSSIGSPQGSSNKRVDFAAINETACVNGRSLIQELIPGGKFESLDEYIVRSPKPSDKPPGFFSINCRNGKWRDFAAKEGGGDFVSLVGYLRCCSESDAALELAAKLKFIALSTCTTSTEEEAACDARLQGVNENRTRKAAQQQKKPQAIVGRDRLRWRKEGDHLYLYHRSSRRPLVGVVPDSKYPGMFRVRYPNGALSDFVNLTRAKDAAAAFALRGLNSKAQGSAAERPDARQKSIRVSEPPPDHSRGAALRNGFLAISGREP
jgi:hypothetical protein